MALLQRVEETLNGSTCYILIRMTSSHEQTKFTIEHEPPNQLINPSVFQSKN